MSQQVTVSLLDLALLSVLSSLFGMAAVLAFSVGIQLSRGRRGEPAQTPVNSPSSSNPIRLGDPHWEKVRNARLEMAGHRCEVCNASGGTLHAHHRTYARQGQELVEDVIILCRSCHGLFHKNFDLAERDGATARPKWRIVNLADYEPASEYAVPVEPPVQGPLL